MAYISANELSVEDKKAIQKEFNELQFISEKQFTERVKELAQKYHLSYATLMEIIYD